MRLIVVLLINTLLVSSIIFSCSENRDNNSVGLGDEIAAITGNIRYSFSFFSETMVEVIEGVSVHVSGENIDISDYTDSTGAYYFSNLPPGNYTVTPSQNGLHFIPRNRGISLNGIDKKLQNFYGLEEDDKTLYIRVKVADTDSNAISGVNIVVIGGGNIITNITNAKGYCPIPLRLGSTYTITPEKEGYNYTFEPESSVIKLDEYCEYYINCEFAASYHGIPLYSISGKLTGQYEYSNLYSYKIELEQNGKIIDETSPEYDGNYSFNGLKNGIYTIRYEDFSILYELVPASITVNLNGKDVIVQDVVRRYTGPTYYVITGRVIDEKNIGIPEVDLIFHSRYVQNVFKTDSDGIYSKKLQFFNISFQSDSLAFSIKPQKDFYYFTPLETSITLFRQEGIINGGEIIVPDFIGYSYLTLEASDYFPINAGSTWTYERSEDSGEPYDFTVTITGTVNHDGKIYHRMSEPGPWRFTDFRIENNNVYTYFDGEQLVFLDFSGEPAREWEMGIIAGTYTRKGTFMGTETLETPAGIFENCAHFETKVVYGETSYDSYDLWYAPGVGLVRSVKIVENYGRRLEYVVDELKEYETL